MQRHRMPVKLKAKEKIDVSTNLNSQSVDPVTGWASDARDARGRIAVVDEIGALKQLIRMVLLVRGKGEKLEPVTIESIKRMKEIVGIGSMTRSDGTRYWIIREGVKIRLEAAGIDSESGVVVDEERFEVAVRGKKQEEALRLERKYAGKDRAWREEAIRASLGRWRRPAEKKVVNVGHFLGNQVLNSMIVKEIRGMEGEEGEEL